MNPGVVRRAIGVWCTTAALWLGWCGGVALWSDERLDPENSHQVLIFQNGRTLAGKISRSPNGYVVEQSAGRLVVPFDEVRVIGDSLTDAYHRLQESFVEKSATTHYELAKWCWTHQLREEARSELVMALDRDADHEASRDFLERIDEQLAATRRKPAPVTPAVRMARGIELPEVESLSGLSRETATRYSTRIQPLLLNKCGNASCHGPQSKTEFRLDPIRGTGPGHRMYSERNLATVLEQLDLARPDRSRLLTASDGNHGGLNRAIFYGPAGEKQRQMLKEWVQSVTKEQSAAQQQQDRRPSVAKQKSAASPATIQDEALTEHEPEPTERARMASVTTAAEAELEVEEEAGQVDAFDPAVFNRKHHGRPEEKSSRRPKPLEKDTPQEPMP